MTSAQPIYRLVCLKCLSPALTFDNDGKPLCADHATVFVAASRIESKDDDRW